MENKKAELVGEDLAPHYRKKIRLLGDVLLILVDASYIMEGVKQSEKEYVNHADGLVDIEDINNDLNSAVDNVENALSYAEDALDLCLLDSRKTESK